MCQRRERGAPAQVSPAPPILPHQALEQRAPGDIWPHPYPQLPALHPAPIHRCRGFSRPCAGSSTRQDVILLPMGGVEPTWALNWGDCFFPYWPSAYSPFCQHGPSLSHPSAPAGTKINSSHPLLVGRCTQWRLRARRLLRKFTCLKGKSELPLEAAVSGTGPEGHGDQAQADCPGKEEAEDEEEVTANVAQSGGFPLDPVPEQEKNKVDPPEHLHGDPGETLEGSAQRSQHSSGEVTLLQENREVSVGGQRETIWKDHGYCGVGETRPLPCALSPCPLREHDYCWNREAGALALADHGYCRVTKLRYRSRVQNITYHLETARATLHRRKSQVGRIIRKAKEFIWFYKPCISTRVEVPPDSSGAISGLHIPPAPAAAALWMGTPGEFCATEQEIVSTWPCGEGMSQEGMSEVIYTSMESSEPAAAPPTSSAAAEEPREAPPPEACEHPKAQGAQPIRSPNAAQTVEGHEPVNPNYVSLCDTYKIMVQMVNNVPDSKHQNQEHGSHSQCNGFHSVVVQTVETFFTAKPPGVV